MKKLYPLFGFCFRSALHKVSSEIKRRCAFYWQVRGTAQVGRRQRENKNDMGCPRLDWVSVMLGFDANPVMILIHHLFNTAHAGLRKVALSELEQLVSPYQRQGSGFGNIAMPDRKLFVGRLENLHSSEALYGNVSLVGVTDREPIAHRTWLILWGLCRTGVPCQCTRLALWRRWCLLLGAAATIGPWK